MNEFLDVVRGVVLESVDGLCRIIGIEPTPALVDGIDVAVAVTAWWFVITLSGAATELDYYRSDI